MGAAWVAGARDERREKDRRVGGERREKTRGERERRARCGDGNTRRDEGQKRRFVGGERVPRGHLLGCA